MEDSARDDALGLVAVHLPDLGEWQALVVRSAYKEHGERVLREIREANAQHGATKVRKPSGAYGEEEPTVGGLCGSLAQVFAMSRAEPRPEGAHARALVTTMEAVAYALRAVTGERYMLVTGRRDAGGKAGLHSSLRRIEARNVDDARDKIAAEIDRAERVSNLTERLTGGLLDPMRSPGAERRGHE